MVDFCSLRMSTVTGQVSLMPLKAVKYEAAISNKYVAVIFNNMWRLNLTEKEPQIYFFNATIFDHF